MTLDEAQAIGILLGSVLNFSFVKDGVKYSCERNSRTLQWQLLTIQPINSSGYPLDHIYTNYVYFPTTGELVNYLNGEINEQAGIYD